MATRNMPRPQLVEKPEAEIAWHDRPRIAPGTYMTYVRTAKTYRDAGFKRWTALLMFDVLDATGMKVVARVPMWLNLGGGVNPKAGRRGRYFQEWVRANGGPPTRGDRLSPRIFVRRLATVEVADTAGEAAYSVVRQILSWETGASAVQVINKSPIKDGKGEATQAEPLASSECQDSAPPRVEGNQVNTPQGRAVHDHRPQRQGTTPSPSPLLDEQARAERIQSLKAQEKQAREIAAAAGGRNY